MTLPALHGCQGTLKMGQPRSNYANDSRVLSSFLIILLLDPTLHVDPYWYFSTMGITTHAAISKEKPIRTTITPKQAQQSTCISKSPHSENINSLLAETNLPTSHFDNILKALCPTTGWCSNRDDTLGDPCDLEPPADKNTQITQIVSPTGVDTFTPGATSPVNNADPAANKESQDQQTPSTEE